MLIQKLTDFRLDGFYPYVTTLNHSVETGQKLGTILPTIPAKVPGSVYHDLLEAGLIDDPYYEMNSLKCEWVKDRWWRYRTTFNLDAACRGKTIVLTLHGIDYKAIVTLNDVKIGEHEGMYTPFRADITGIVREGEENLLDIVLESAPDEMGQIGYTERTHTQKARFGYKWDWSVRLVNLGLYEEVTLEAFDAARIESTHLRTKLEPESGACVLTAGVELEGYADAEVCVETAVLYNGEEIDSTRTLTPVRTGETANCSLQLNIEQPRLWWPNGHGEQPLYTVRTRVYAGDVMTDEKNEQLGIRTMTYRRCDNSAADSLPYTLVVNGKPIYLKGVNITPLDSMYGSIPASRYEHLVRAAAEAHINLIRVWGGGLIESALFYDLCDQYGILVWQEFIQSSSGINNVPSQQPHFLELLRRTAVQATKSRRNHACLAFWNGGNELTETDGVPVGYDNANIAMLKAVVDEYDPDRLMLPSSASGPLEFLNPDKPGCNHDVHGPWKYGGVEEHYTLFNRSDSLLHSEFGVDGMANMEVLNAVLSPANRKVFSMEENFTWRHHGEWWDTYERDTEIFGAFEREDLETFIACSQFIQAEGIRYALEANRRRAFSNAGSLIWQFNESWPNVSGTNVYDWYGGKKLAYYYLRDAYRPVNPNLRYDRLIFRAGEKVQADAFVSNDGAALEAVLRITVSGMDGTVLSERETRVQAAENVTTAAERIELPMPAGGLVIDLSLELPEGPVCSRYLLFCAGENGLIDKTMIPAHTDWYRRNRLG